MNFQLWWVKALVAAAMLAAVAWTVHVWNEHLRAEGRAEVQAKWDGERAKQTAAALAESQANAKETQRRLARQKDAQDAHDQEMARARADAVAAAGAADGLRSQLAAFTAAARRASGNSAPVGDGATTGSAVDLLADLYRRADERAGILSESLDAAHAAGVQCERSYDAISALTVKP